MKPVGEMSYHELQARAKELGLEKVAGVSKAALIEEIEKRSPPAPASEPAAEAPKEGILSKVVNAVDHMLHPDKPENSEVQPAEGGEVSDREVVTRKRIESRSDQSDLAKHPKFDKFKSQGEN